MKKSIALLFTFVFVLNLYSQTVIDLWEGNPPTSNEIVDPEQAKDHVITNVAIPNISVYLPDKSTNKRMAVIICPGGSYACLAYNHEGVKFAKWFQSQGIAGIILKYRMPNGHENIPLEDAQQAFRIVRSKAKEWGIDNNKVGVAGFSAGGHLASTVSTHFSSVDLRPSFSILFYPVITMDDTYTHAESKQKLLGKTSSLTNTHIYSNEKQVNSNTPPAILLLSDDDKAVMPENSIMYYEALKRNNIPSTMYIFPTGGHGWGVNEDFKYNKEMLSLLKMWLEEMSKQ